MRKGLIDKGRRESFMQHTHTHTHTHPSVLLEVLVEVLNILLPPNDRKKDDIFRVMDRFF